MRRRGVRCLARLDFGGAGWYLVFGQGTAGTVGSQGGECGIDFCLHGRNLSSHACCAVAPHVEAPRAPGSLAEIQRDGCQ